MESSHASKAEKQKKMKMRTMHNASTIKISNGTSRLSRLTMSAANRALARLPADLFEDLITRLDDVTDSGEDLRNAICAKLISVPRKTRNSGAVYDSIKTVGALLQLSMPALLRALDPILTYGM
jgi:hypothetical protein